MLASSRRSFAGCTQPNAISMACIVLGLLTVGCEAAARGAAIDFYGSHDVKQLQGWALSCRNLGLGCRLRGGGGEKKEKVRGIKDCPQKATEHRLFIANLPSGLNDEGLFEAFELFGDIEEARVMRDIETGASRRMAYVSFKKLTDMDEALEEMNGAVNIPSYSNQRKSALPIQDRTDQPFVPR